ncbi:putative germin-like protein 2-3 [Cryptomeria japonica]|uniref:putative germin-like protein 2-3 n=1 Tax=Cryptomeria japonica TaxID=3369 RepID=UPI0027DA0581|nr:putative germin-like protein 2-3 [Cryptomeria japonica]XP_059071001.1 putative germin-like protein 2-3 [Cryptomeria japonica]XP_059071009.1 putative germin-like protein 2-3 [Cryptomeria japonica]
MLWACNTQFDYTFISRAFLSDSSVSLFIMGNRMIYFTLGLFLLICCYSDNVMAADSDPLQDFCVADKESMVKVNGFVCKDPKDVSAEDFFFGGLGQAGNTDNAVGSNVTMANVMQIPGLNTFGISLVRIDYAVGGINPPHTHPRATEVLVLLEGQLLQNVGHENAVAIAALSSKLPVAQTIANSLFAADPPLPDSVLAKAFRITQELVDFIQKKFA